MIILLGIAGVIAGVFVFCALNSIVLVGPAEVGLVTKRFAARRLADGNPIAFKGEAGYQADLLMPGLRFKLWPIYAVQKHPWVQVRAGEIGVVVAQVGASLPIGAKSAHYDRAFGSFGELRAFLAAGGGKGVQRPVLPPGTLVPVHPVAFLVLTAHGTYGVPVSPELRALARSRNGLGPEAFGLTPDQLQVTVISPSGDIDYVGVVTALEGDSLPASDIASRLEGFADLAALEADEAPDAELVEALLSSKNDQHGSYQDFQAFLDRGGRIGLQHDPLLYGAYLLNPFLVQVELVPMLIVRQGEVAVVKSFVGLPTLDTSGTDFKHGSLVRPGHRGIWQEPLRTGKYAINPRCYAAEIVPTSILTLNWSDEVSQAHNLDSHLSAIHGKSREGFEFTIDLQVQIHVPDTRAPKVISMVGTMHNLVNEVLQSAVGNHFRNTLQDQEAIRFIETRMKVQQAALVAVSAYLGSYDVETKGVYIQNMEFPEELVRVLTEREVAHQEKATFDEQRLAQTARIAMEKARGEADMQNELAASEVTISINGNLADAREAEARGEAAYIEGTGRAEAAKVEAIGLAEAEGYRAQREAIGELATALVAVAKAISDGQITVVPEVLVTGGGGALDGLAATVMQAVRNGAVPALAPADDPEADDPEANAPEVSAA